MLDACRYDYFASLNFFDGELLPARSPASCTVDWLRSVFPGRYDLTYVSATPMVNSRGVPVYGYRASDHFRRIVDVWDFGWDEELGTVPPWEVNEAALRNVDGRMVIHYLQPHGPYIGSVRLTVRGQRRAAPSHPFAPDLIVVELVRRGAVGLELLRAAYRENLRLALRYVEELVGRLPHKRIVVTSDHGELLGEGGRFLHPCGLDVRELRVVPWLEVPR